MSKHGVVVEEVYDGFSIVVYNEHGLTVFMENFDQEDSKESLVNVFKFLGHDSSYTEIF